MKRLLAAGRFRNRLTLCVVGIVSLTFLSPSWAETAVKSSIDVSRGDLDGKQVIFLGDSLTAQGVYIGFIETIIRRQFPDQSIDFICLGLSSETTSGLTDPGHPFPRPCVHERLDRVLERAKPDIVVACYGLNDGIYHPASKERTKAYHDGMNKLVEKSKKSGAQVVLITPPPFDAASCPTVVPKDADEFSWKTPYEDYTSVMAEYGKWILDRDDVIAIDIHAPLTAWAKKRREREPDFKNGDGVHANKVGYMAMANAILESMGVFVPDETPQATLDRISKDPLYSAVEQRRVARSKGWMRHTGYIRGDVNQKPESLGRTEEDAAKALKKVLGLL